MINDAATAAKEKQDSFLHLILAEVRAAVCIFLEVYDIK